MPSIDRTYHLGQPRACSPRLRRPFLLSLSLSLSPLFQLVQNSYRNRRVFARYEFTKGNTVRD